ncbi:RsfA family transcriptional regulator [Sutcliffiella sp. NC1]|uniref:RsfA family transcriptional regulator n=1 Tax=Sutcliffiella sp. NC1 TaxID=3004096 RepID=UPI0022DCF939|nr:RsfA family transcriptional regulator [Sutcliffiella sp. NC1]WBL13942.1 RsfA family transcriptional regulator [Sutcliffiella sp. NC1]
MKVRQDAWSHEEDLLLAETVLRYIRDGGTQLGAFEEVGDKLNRTSAACGFRWNAEVRKKYEHAVAVAKKQRKEKKRALDKMKKSQQSTDANSMEVELIPAVNSAIKRPKKEEPLLTIELSEEVAPVKYSAVTNQLTLDDCIQFLQTYQKESSYQDTMQLENERLKRENQALQQKNMELQQHLEKLEKQQDVIQEDYQMLVKIMERARKLTVLEDEVM